MSDYNPDPVFRSEGVDDADKRLVSLYEEKGVPLDNLAYTAEFDDIHARLKEGGDNRTKQQLFHRLLTLRKSGRLPRLRSS